MKSLFLLLILVLFQFKGFTQFVSNEIDNVVSDYIKNPQNKLTFFYTIEKYQDDTGQLKKIMVELVKHLHKDEEIDFQIVNSLLDIATGRFDNSSIIKDEAVLKLTDTITDSIMLSSNRNFISENLKYYDFSLYNEQARNNLLKSVKDRKLCFKGAILEVGALNMPEAKQVLQAIIDSNWTEFKDAALVALCRMGDKGSLNTFFSKINKVDLAENAFDQHYRDIEYIKQPQSIRFLATLILFKKSDFNTTAVNSLAGLQSPTNTLFLTERNILLVGFLGIKISAIEMLAKQELADDFNLSENKVWNSKLCLARMGNVSIARECIAIMKKKNVNQLTYIAVCNYASYMRGTGAVEYLEELLASNLIMPKSPKKAVFNGEPYASHAVYALQSVIMNMPVTKKCVSCYSIEEIKRCRIWMKNNHGDYKINKGTF